MSVLLIKTAKSSIMVEEREVSYVHIVGMPPDDDDEIHAHLYLL